MQQIKKLVSVFALLTASLSDGITMKMNLKKANIWVLFRYNLCIKQSHLN